MADWYARPLVFVSDIDRASAFYVDRLGFTEDWRFDEGGTPFVAQVSREGCDLILSTQWPDKIGTGRIFVSLAGPVDEVRAELAGRGVDVRDGQWGYRLLVVADPDGNELWFPYPHDEAQEPV